MSKIIYSRITVLILFLFSLNSFASYEVRQAGMSPERLEKIGPSLSKYVSEGRLPGLITAVARKGKVVHFEVQGYADVENRIPLQEDSLFRIYSMSKPITGVALMILIEEGKVRLNDPVALYIPEFAFTKVMKVKDDGSVSLEKLNKPITIRDLATHTSGIAYSFTANKQLREIYEENRLAPYFFIDNMTSVTDLEEGSFVTSTKAFPDVCSFSSALASKAPLMHQPAEKLTYGMSVDVLGCVIERASGQSFDVFLKQRIFDPLGMSDTSFDVPNDKADRFSNLYAFPMGVRRLSPEWSESLAKERKLMALVDPMTTSPYLNKATFFDGGSGLVSSTRDYLTFTQMLVNGGSLGKVRILSRKSVELMSSSHLSERVLKTDMSRYKSGGKGHGLTVGVTTDPGLAGEYGSEGKYYLGGAAGTVFWIDPKEELVAVAMTQLLGSPWPLRTDFEALVYAAIDD